MKTFKEYLEETVDRVFPYHTKSSKLSNGLNEFTNPDSLMLGEAFDQPYSWIRIDDENYEIHAYHKINVEFDITFIQDKTRSYLVDFGRDYMMSKDARNTERPSDNGVRTLGAVIEIMADHMERTGANAYLIHPASDKLEKVYRRMVGKLSHKYGLRVDDSNSSRSIVLERM